MDDLRIGFLFHVVTMIPRPSSRVTSTKFHEGALLLYFLNSLTNKTVCLRVKYISCFLIFLRSIPAKKRLITRQVGKRNTVFDPTVILITQLLHKDLHRFAVRALHFHQIANRTLLHKIENSIQIYVFKRLISRNLRQT